MTLIRRVSTLALALLLVQSAALAQNPIRDYRRAHEHAILKEFMDLLAIPNVASDQEKFVERRRPRRNDAATKAAAAPAGSRRKSAPPAVYGEWKHPGATRTLIFYAHYDGQPTDPMPMDRHFAMAAPQLRRAALEVGGRVVEVPRRNEPINPEWRLYARSAADDKAGVMAILTAFDALIASGAKPTANLKFFFDGEEEAGSPHLAEVLRANKSITPGDAWIICDGPVHQSGRKQVVFGVRGDTNVDVTVYGAKRPLHSGHYGNWSPNPAHNSGAIAVVHEG